LELDPQAGFCSFDFGNRPALFHRRAIRPLCPQKEIRGRLSELSYPRFLGFGIWLAYRANADQKDSGIPLNPLLSEILFYAAAPLALGNLLYFGHSRKKIVLMAVALLPIFQQSLPCSCLYLLASFYALVRAVCLAFDNFRMLKQTLNPYAIKLALDELPWGYLVASKNGDIRFINEAFVSILNFYKIPTHQKAKDLEKKLRDNAQSSLPNGDFVLKVDERYLLVKRLSGRSIECTVHDVSAVVQVNQELQNTLEQLKQEEVSLNAVLDEAKNLAQEKARESVALAVHDTFADEVSLIHQILQSPNLNDLRPLKELVHRGLHEATITYASLEEFEYFYSLLGIAFTNRGPFNQIPDQEEALGLLREATDNAIRHGGASHLDVICQKEAQGYRLIIRNDGALPLRIAAHNGLDLLSQRLQEKAGSLSIELTDSSTVNAFFPAPRQEGL